MVSRKRANEAEDIARRRRAAVWLAICELWKRHDGEVAGRPRRKRKFYERGTQMKIERLINWLGSGGRGMLPAELKQIVEECKGK